MNTTNQNQRKGWIAIVDVKRFTKDHPALI